MFTINKVILMGWVGADAEMGQSEFGPALKIVLATERGTKQADGSWKNDKDWHTVFAIGKHAEYLNGRVKKGCSVYVEGRQRIRKLESGRVVDVVVDAFEHTVKITSKPKLEDENVPAHGTPFPTKTNTTPYNAQVYKTQRGGDDDMPF